MKYIRNIEKSNLKEDYFVLVKFMGCKRNTTEFLYLWVVKNLDELEDQLE